MGRLMMATALQLGVSFCNSAIPLKKDDWPTFENVWKTIEIRGHCSTFISFCVMEKVNILYQQNVFRPV